MSASQLRRSLLLLACLAGAAIASPALATNPALTAVGPTSPVHPFPLWYQDSNLVKAEPCLDATTTVPPNPCALAASPTGGVNNGPFDPAQPIVFPTNFPSTFVYWQGNIEVPVAGNNRGLVYTAAVLGTFTGPGFAATTPQVITQIRFVTTPKLTPNTSYTITHPFGVFTLTTDATGVLCTGGVKACTITFPNPPVIGLYTGVLSPNPSANPNDATVGTFLPFVTPPLGFLGDGAGRSLVTSSPTVPAQNFVRIAGPGVGTAAGFACTNGVTTNCAEGNAFTVIGKLFNAAGGPATLLHVTGLADGGAGVAQTFTVTATDVNGNTAAGYAGTVHFTSTDLLATLPADAKLTAGVGTFSVTPRTLGAFTLTATDSLAARPTGSQTVAVAAGPLAALSVVSGDGQAGAVGLPLASPFVVRAVDAFGNPKPGVSVLFAPVTAGASVSAALVVTDAAGLASATGTLSTTVGADAFTASAAGVAPATFTATGTPGPPVTLAVSPAASSGTAGVQATLTVTARDGFGNVSTGSSAGLTIISTDPQAVLPAAPALVAGVLAFPVTLKTSGGQVVTVALTGSPAISATATVTVTPAAPASLAVSGLPATTTAGVPATLAVVAHDAFGNLASGSSAALTVTSSDPAAALPAAPALAGGGASLPVTLRTAGARSVTVALTGTPAVGGTASSTVVATAAATLAIASGNGQAGTVGAPLAAPLVARASDAFGNPVAGITVTFAATTAGASVAPASAVTLATGLASTTATLASGTLGAQAFSASSTGLAGSPLTFTATAAAGLPTTVAITGLAASTTAGAAAPATVTVRDQFGNVATNYGGTVSFASSDTTAVLPAPVALAGGTGGFSFTFKKAGAQTVTVTAGGVAAPAGSAGTTVAAAAGATLVALSGAGQSGLAGAVLAAPFVVRVADAFGNPVAGTTITFGAPLTGSVTPATPVTAADGTASATGTLPTGAGATAFSATAAGLAGSPLTFAATAVAGPPAVLQLAGLPAATTAGGSVTVTVDAFDAHGNPASNFGGTLALTSSDPGAILPASPAMVLGASTFPVTFHTAGARSLGVSLVGSPGVTTSGSTTVAPAQPAALALTGLPASVVAGTAQLLSLAATDAFGNACTNFTGPVTFTSSDPAATLPAAATLSGGAGTFPVTLKTAGSRAVTAALTTPAVSTSASAAVTAAAAAALAVSAGDGQLGVVGTALAGRLVVKVSDAFGNAVAGSPVTFAAITAGASVSPASAATAADGTASTLATLAASPVGAQAFRAAAAGLSPASVTFTATAQPGVPTSVAIAGLPGSVTAGAAQAISVSVLDQAGNVATAYAGSVSFTSTDPGAVLPPPTALVNGAGSFSVTFKRAGPQSVTVTASGATPFVQTAATTVLAAAPATIAAVSGGGQTGAVGTSLPTPLVVKVTDAFGNAARSVTVTFSAPAGGSVTPSTAATAADGTASTAGTLPTVPGATSFGAATSGVAAGASFAATAVPGTPASLQLAGVRATSAAGATVTVTVSAFDAQVPGNPATNFNGAVIFSSSDPLAVLPASPVLVGGSGTFPVIFGAAGPRTLSVAVVGLPGATGSASTTVTAGPASGFAVASGDPQTGTVGAPLAAPFVVRVSDLFGNPVQGTSVSFGTTSGGSVSAPTVATGVDGTAATTGTLGHASGPQAFVASASGLTPATLTFHATAGAGPAATLALTGLPASLAAGTSASLTVSVFDAFGNAATGFAGQVALTSSDPAAALPPAAALAQGVGTFPVTLKSTGTRTVTAAAVGSPALTDTSSTVVGPAAPSALALVSSPGSAGKVGQSTGAPVVVKVTDSLGNAVPGYPVAFAAPGGGSISPASATTAADGTATATPTLGTVAKTYDFTATAAGLGGSPVTVTVTASADVGAHLALERAAGPNAIDCGCYDLTARLQDQYGNTVAQGLPGVTVAVTAPGHALVTQTDLVTSGLPGATVTGTLKADGTALVRVCDQTPEASAVTVAAPGLTGASANLTWDLGPLDPAASAIASDTPLLTAFSGRAHLTVTPHSACGNPLGAGRAVLLGLNGPGSITSTTDRGDGSYAATVDVTPCPATLATQVTARVGNTDLAPLDLAIACVAPSADQTSVTLSRAALVLCDNPAKDAVTVTVTPRDASGLAMGPGNQVSLAMSGLTGGAVTDVGDGSYTASLSATGCADTAARPITVRVNGVDLAPPGAALAVSCAPVDPGASGVSVPAAAGVADGHTPVGMTVAALNTCGEPARSRPVALSATLGTLSSPGGTTDAAGTLASALTSAQAGSATVTATVDGVTLPTVQVTFAAPPKGGGGCATGGGSELLGLLGLGLAARLARRRRA